MLVNNQKLVYWFWVFDIILWCTSFIILIMKCFFNISSFKIPSYQWSIMPSCKYKLMSSILNINSWHYIIFVSNLIILWKNFISCDNFSFFIRPNMNFSVPPYWKYIRTFKIFFIFWIKNTYKFSNFCVDFLACYFWL